MTCNTRLRSDHLRCGSYLLRISFLTIMASLLFFSIMPHSFAASSLGQANSAPLARRYSLDLQTDWSVSPSAKDAALMASGKPYQPADLVYATDKENYPIKTNLPAPRNYGRRNADSPNDAPGKGNANVGRVPSRFLTYARLLPVPATWTGHTVYLHLNNARYHVTVSIDGKQVDQYVGGTEPHRIDITRFLTPGTNAMLCVTVGDKGIGAVKPYDPAADGSGGEYNLIHPVNIWYADVRDLNEASIEAVPAVHTEYVFANPRVMLKKLQYTVVLVNDSRKDWKGHVRSEAVGAKRLVNEDVTIPAGKSIKLYREIPWANAILWDTDNPHLYDLKTTLSTRRQTVDVHQDYFGFREFTINGPDFYLNGKKIHLLSNSGHVQHAQDTMSLDEKIRFLQEAKEIGHINHVRLHAKPEDKRWVLAADRVGMLLTTETALWTMVFSAIDWVGSEEAVYQNLRNHFFSALVWRDRNNPSVISWSLSNEMSPITEDYLQYPAMASLTRIFKKIIAEAQAEDSSRVIQMSSAMDFIGNLSVCNLHYPKAWDRYPDYPHTACWNDGSFLFPWYPMLDAGKNMPAWSWRRDKPLVIDEYSDIEPSSRPIQDGAASIVGDVAYDDEDGGIQRVQEKIWPMEAIAYRRQGVSGFCAWSFLLWGTTNFQEIYKLPQVQAYCQALRPVAVLDHTYRTRYFAGDQVAVELSIHNDSRHDMPLMLTCEVRRDGNVIWSETRPQTTFEPGGLVTFTNRFLSPKSETDYELTYRAILSSGNEVVDAWTKTLSFSARSFNRPLPGTCAVIDPDNVLEQRFSQRGLRGCAFLSDISATTDLSRYTTLWLSFDQAQITVDDWQQLSQPIMKFVADGGCVILDKPFLGLPGMPFVLRNGQGFAGNYDGYASENTRLAGNRLEITYAYNAAPNHPVLRTLTEDDLCLWGDDYYVARRCFAIPTQGNAIPLLVAGVDRLDQGGGGLTSTALMEIRHGQGSFLVSTLELMSKLLDEPKTANLVYGMATYRPKKPAATIGMSVTDATMSALNKVGYTGANSEPHQAFTAEVAIIDGDRFDVAIDLPELEAAMKAGRSVVLHDLGAEKTRQVLKAFSLPGEVTDVAAPENGAPSRSRRQRSIDAVRHTSRLSDGMTGNYLYGIAWTTGIQLEKSDRGMPLTRFGAVAAYTVGDGTLIIDNLRWQRPDMDRPDRAQRYLMCLLTNLGVPLTHTTEKPTTPEYNSPTHIRGETGYF